jgi:hypothetical protein
MLSSRFTTSIFAKKFAQPDRALSGPGRPPEVVDNERGFRAQPLYGSPVSRNGRVAIPRIGFPS